MNSNFARTAVAVLFTTIFAACGGGSAVSEVGGNNTVTLPENGGSTAPSDLSKQEALSALSPAAISKLSSGFLDRLLEQTSNDVIAEFVDESSSTDSLEQKKVTYANTKSRVAAALASSEYEVITEYNALPMSFVRLKSRRALVNFLNNVDVKAIYENQKYSLPVLIYENPPPVLSSS